MPARSRAGTAGVLLQISFRNLFASKAKTFIVGGIILFGAALVVVGSSLLDTVDRGMRGSVQGSLAGQLQSGTDALAQAKQAVKAARGLQAGQGPKICDEGGNGYSAECHKRQQAQERLTWEE